MGVLAVACLLALIGFAFGGGVLSHQSTSEGVLRVTLTSDCALLGVTADSFVPGALGEYMRVDRASFEGDVSG